MEQLKILQSKSKQATIQFGGLCHKFLWRISGEYDFMSSDETKIVYTPEYTPFFTVSKYWAERPEKQKDSQYEPKDHFLNHWTGDLYSHNDSSFYLIKPAQAKWDSDSALQTLKSLTKRIMPYISQLEITSNKDPLCKFFNDNNFKEVSSYYGKLLLIMHIIMKSDPFFIDSDKGANKSTNGQKDKPYIRTINDVFLCSTLICEMLLERSEEKPNRLPSSKMQSMVKPTLNDIKALIEQAEKLKQEVEQLKKKRFLTSVQSEAIKQGNTGTDTALYLLRLSYIDKEKCWDNFGIVDSYFTPTGSLKKGRFAQNLGDFHTDNCDEEPERIEWYNPDRHKGLFVRYDFDEKKFRHFLSQHTAKQRQLYREKHIQPLINQLDTDLTPWLPFMKTYVDTSGIQNVIKSADTVKLSDVIYDFKRIHKVVETEKKWENESERTEDKKESTANIDSQQKNNVFKPNGDFWTIIFQDEVLPLVKHNKRMLYLYELLKSPKKKISALELCQIVNKTTQQDTRPETPKNDASKSKKAMSYEESFAVLDKESIKNYEKNLNQLDASLETAKKNNDLAEQERLQGERDTVIGQLKANTGIGGKLRKFGGDAKKAKDTVSKAISRAKNDIKHHNEKLFQHLENSVRLSNDCSYNPEPSIDWQF